MLAKFTAIFISLSSLLLTSLVLAGPTSYSCDDTANTCTCYQAGQVVSCLPFLNGNGDVFVQEITLGKPVYKVCDGEGICIDAQRAFECLPRMEAAMRAVEPFAFSKPLTAQQMRAARAVFTATKRACWNTP